MKYLFKTQTTMKKYNCEQYWIDNNFIHNITIQADNIKEAFQKYVDLVNKEFYGVISKNALKHKQPMYIDDENGETQQIGYVLTGYIDIENKNGTGYTKQYIDLWVEIIETKIPNFEEAK